MLLILKNKDSVFFSVDTNQIWLGHTYLVRSYSSGPNFKKASW